MAMVLAASSSKPVCNASHCVSPACTSLSKADELVAVNNNPADTKTRAKIITPPRAMLPHAIAGPARLRDVRQRSDPAREVDSTLVYFTYRDRPHSLHPPRRGARPARVRARKKNLNKEAQSPH